VNAFRHRAGGGRSRGVNAVDPAVLAGGAILTALRGDDGLGRNFHALFQFQFNGITGFSDRRSVSTCSCFLRDPADRFLRFCLLHGAARAGQGRLCNYVC